MIPTSTMRQNTVFAMQKIIQLMNNNVLNTSEFRKILKELDTTKNQFEFYSTTNEQDFYRFLNKIFFEELPSVKVRIWNKQKMFESPMATHTSLESGKMYASLWPGKLVSSVEEDRNKTHQDASGKYGKTIELRSLNTEAIENAFKDIKNQNIPWDAYGSCNCAYLSYLGSVCFNVISVKRAVCSLKEVLCPTGDNSDEAEELYKKEHNKLNCSGLVLVLMEHGGINKVVDLPLLSARKNKILKNMITGSAWVMLVFFMGIIVEVFLKIPVPYESPFAKYVGYCFYTLGGSTILAHLPYWIANVIYSCRGIGFFVTPKGVRWLAEKLEGQESALKLLIEKQINASNYLLLNEPQADRKLSLDNKPFHHLSMTTTRTINECSVLDIQASQPVIFSAIGNNAQRTDQQPLLNQTSRKRECCVIL